MKIARVFPRRTALTPTDPMAFIGDPPLSAWRPVADEVHVSVTFTWDIQEGQRLAKAWGNYYPVVRLGGPAFGDRPNGFVPGVYIREGVTFTTRGCDNRCPWCLVPEREGKLVEIRDFAPGHIVQDNNLLQASREHIENVLAMLRQQKKAAVFSGGLQASLVDDWFAEQLATMRVEQVFLAADTLGALRPLERALDKLAFLGRKKLRVYAMIGMGETPSQAVERLEAVWQMGGLPFAQLYQPAEQYIRYSREWLDVRRAWSRPAVMYALHKREKGRKALEEEQSE